MFLNLPLLLLFLFNLLCSSSPLLFSTHAAPTAPTTPPPPIWTDFQTSFVTFAAKWGPARKTAGIFYYKPSSSHQRVDYFAFCEPHTNISDPRFDCSYIFTNGYVYFRSENNCCWWAQMGPTDPKLWVDATYVGVDILHGKAANHWVKKIDDWQAEYFADIATYVPIRFQGFSIYSGVGGLDFIFYDQAAEMDESLFEVAPECRVKCPWADQMVKNWKF